MNILVAEIASSIAAKLENLTGKSANRIESVTSLKKILDVTQLQDFDIIILTSELFQNQRQDALKIFRKINTRSPKTQIIFLVDESDIKLVRQALMAGAYQYAKLPVSDEELMLLVKTAGEQNPQIVETADTLVNQRNRLGEIVGHSHTMQQVYDQVIQAAETDIPVLILGETGTGKDLVAYTIHRLSSRKDEPYLAVSLGALPPQLVASELFGHEKGAFTGAVQQHKGIFEQGSHGTVFLDEIDSTDDRIQVSLLRLIEQKKFTRLGGRGALRSQTRLITASNENLEELVDNGSFRIDLFYRLDVFRINLPPLRKRLSDIPLLVNELLVKYNQIYKRRINKVSPKCMDVLLNYEWPGNIRELKNALQRAVLVCDNEVLEIDHLPQRFHTLERTKLPSVTFRLGTPLESVEREMIVNALAQTQNNRKRAAELLGISRRALYNKLKKHNL